MADKDFINKTFKQEGSVCAMASYGTVIEYFSNGNLKIEKVLDRYINFFSLIYFSVGKNKIGNKHKEISKHFHSYCIPKNLRGFDFIKQLHEDDSFDTKQFCQIVLSNAQLHKISDTEIEILRKELVDNDAIAIVLYKVDNNHSHAVTIGYDTFNNCYFSKDPEKNKIDTEDIISTKEICEFIIFNDY